MDYIDLPIGIVFVNPPATAGDPGAPGQMAYDADYIYICIADDTWKRVAITTWP